MPMIKKRPETEKVSSSQTVSTNGSYVYVEKSITQRNGDDYIKCTVGVQLPVNPSEKLLDEAYDSLQKVVELVDQKLDEEFEA